MSVTLAYQSSTYYTVFYEHFKEILLFFSRGKAKTLLHLN